MGFLACGGDLGGESDFLGAKLILLRGIFAALLTFIFAKCGFASVIDCFFRINFGYITFLTLF